MSNCFNIYRALHRLTVHLYTMCMSIIVVHCLPLSIMVTVSRSLEGSTLASELISLTKKDSTLSKTRSSLSAIIWHILVSPGSKVRGKELSGE